jgi:ligand-binding sensor domain-containing protein
MNFSLRTYLLQCIAGLLFFPTAALAQVHPFHSYSVKDGLPSEHITALCQDSRGYLWIGTDNGLSRYDGTEFRNFTTADGLSNLYITEILESRIHPGVFWIGTLAGGLVKMSTGQVSVIHAGNDDISSICEDAGGSVWFTAGGFNFRTRNDSALLVGLSDNFGSNIHPLGDTAMLVFTAKTLTNYSQDGTIRWVRHLALRGDEWVIATMLDRQGGIWGVSSSGTVLRIWGDSVEYHRIGMPLRSSHDIPSHLIQDDHGALWLSTPHGIFIVDTTDYTFRNPSDFGGERIEPSGPILYDREGLIWAGTYADGLIKFTDRRISRIHIRPVNEGAYNLAASTDSSGHIWIATDTALCEVVRRKTNHWDVYYHPVGRRENGNPGPSVVTDPEGHLWVRPGLPAVFDEYRIESSPGSPSRLIRVARVGREIFGGLNIGLTFTLDRNGRGWFPLGTGITAVDLPAKKILRTASAADGLPSDAIRAVLVDRGGKVWCGSWTAGLSVAESASGGFVPAPAGSGLPGAGVRSLLEDRDGSVWIGTRYRGLVRYRQGEYAGISVSDGMLSNAIWSIAATEHRIWCATDVGLEAVDRETCRPLPPKAELIGKRVYSCGAYRNDFVWCVLASDLLVYEQPEEPAAVLPPPVYLKNFSVNGLDMTGKDGNEFGSHQNSCRFDFVGINFRDERNTRYQFRMVGQDSTWSSPVREHTVTYAALPPGRYRFEVRAINTDGVVSEIPANVSFSIVPPLWMRWWFIAAALLLSASAVYSLFRYRLYYLMKMEHLRLHIAGDLHDEVGTNLSSIMVASQVMEKQSALAPDEKHQLKVIGELATTTQDMMRDIVWMLSPHNDSLADLLMRMRETASRLLGPIQYTFVAPEGKILEKVSVEFKRTVHLIFKESLNNIVRHASAHKVGITVLENNGNFTLIIQDDGRGFDASRVTTGLGLRNLRNRADAIGGLMEIRSIQGEGTSVCLTVKIT